MKYLFLLLSFFGHAWGNDLHKIGSQSRALIEILGEGELVYYSTQNESLFHRGKHFKLLTGACGHISSFPTVSICSNPCGREIISIDPSDSPLLNAAYEAFLYLLPRHPVRSEEIFCIACRFIKSEIFPIPVNDKLENFLYDWSYADERVRDDFTVLSDARFWPVIPLDEFIAMRKGVCRHFALVLAYFLDRLQNETSHLPPGKTYVVRDGIGNGHHVWNLFVPQDGSDAWHLDATWETVKNLSHTDRVLNARYGEAVIESEKARFLSPNE